MNSKINVGRVIPWWVGLIGFVGSLGIYVIIAAVAALLGGLGLLGDDISATLLSPVAVSVQILFTCAVLTAMSWFIPKAYNHSSARFLALEPVAWSLALVPLLGIVGMGFLVDEIIFLMHRAWPTVFDTAGLDLFNRIFASASPVAFVAMTAAVAIGPGVGEEFFFRGFILRTFGGGLPECVAVVMSAALFGVIHGDLLQGSGAFLIGIYLGFVALRIGSIWPCVFAHGFNNLLVAMFAKMDTGQQSDVWETGHPVWVLLSSTLAVAVSVWAVMKLTKRNATEPQ